MQQHTYSSHKSPEGCLSLDKTVLWATVQNLFRNDDSDKCKMNIIQVPIIHTFKLCNVTKSALTKKSQHK